MRERAIEERGGPHEFLYEADAREATPGPTPSQTSGPFFAYALVPRAYGYAYADMHPARGPITIEGQVLDGAGEPVRDAMVEAVSPEGYARSGTGADGEHRFLLRTAKPKAGAFSVIVTMRGMLNHAVTRLYLPDAQDAVLAQVPEARRHTLVAKEVAPGRFRFDIHMQGADETVFFDL